MKPNKFYICLIRHMHLTQGNQKNLFIIILLIIGIAIISACNPTKTLSTDQYLLNNNRIKTKIKSLDKDEINAIIKQKPNKKLFGFFRFYLIAHNYSKTGKENKFKKWIANTIAEEPVILDTFLTKKQFLSLNYSSKKRIF